MRNNAALIKMFVCAIAISTSLVSCDPGTVYGAGDDAVLVAGTAFSGYQPWDTPAGGKQAFIWSIAQDGAVSILTPGLPATGSIATLVEGTSSNFALYGRVFSDDLAMQGAFILVDGQMSQLSFWDSVWSSFSSNSDTYFVGTYLDGYSYRPAYWKNGQRSPIEIAINSNTWFSVRSGTEFRNELYFGGSTQTAGYYYFTSYDTADYTKSAAYVRNGQVTTLVANNETTVYNSEAIAAASDAEHVYVGGYIQSWPKTDSTYLSYNSTSSPALWIDGVLTSYSGNGWISGLAVVNNEVYAVGGLSENKGNFYWHNGQRIDLPVPYEFKYVTDHKIHVRANGVYISANYWDNNYVEHACYWKDGVYHDLPTPDGYNRSATNERN